MRSPAAGLLPITVAVKIAIPHLIVLPFFQFIMISAACLKTERERQRLSLSQIASLHHGPQNHDA